MILKSVTLEGIRSYKDETPIPLSTGTTLLAGDVASGKSTILYAIEFALFGLGSFSGTFLLKNGVKKGWVTLVFEADGKDYEVHRALEEKGEKVRQVDCYINGPEGKSRLMAGELKEKVLQILKFNEPPNAKAQSVIYRYAIFTPQEEMKEIIQKKAEERLETLRRAFGIEQYKTAVQNSVAVASKMKERVNYLQGATSDIEEVSRKLEQEKRRTDELSDSLKPLEEKENEMRSQLDIEKKALKALEKTRERIEGAKGKVPLLKRELDGKNVLRERLLDENLKLENKIRDELEPQIRKSQGVKKPSKESKEELKNELKEEREKKGKVERAISKLEERIGNVDSILKNHFCPVCEREIEEGDFSSKLRHLRDEKEAVQKHIDELEGEIERLDALIERVAEYEAAQKDLETITSRLTECRIKVEDNNREARALKPSIESLKLQLESAEDEVKPLEVLLNRIEKQESNVDKVESNLTGVQKDIAGISEKVRGSKENRQQLAADLQTKEEQAKSRDSLVEYKLWLTDYLSPTIQNIEEHVLTNLNQRFNSHFQRWFQVIMEESALAVRVNEQFTPIIEREGYEQEYSALSGGERTSVALAYRLTLNTMVQEVATQGGPNLLILDEPTDGFSKGQLSKVRDVLRELKCPQVILVSHEAELESFADHVIRIDGSSGVSRVTFPTNRLDIYSWGGDVLVKASNVQKQETKSRYRSS